MPGSGAGLLKACAALAIASGPRSRRRIPGVPVRLRIAAAVAVAMTVVLIAAGWLLYTRERSALQGGLDDEVQARVDAIAPYIRRNPRLARIPDTLTLDPEEGFFLVLTRRGSVVDAFPK